MLGKDSPREDEPLETDFGGVVRVAVCLNVVYVLANLVSAAEQSNS